MRIALAIQSLVGGGAERVCVLLANGLADRGHEVTVITVAAESEDAYALARNTSRVVLHHRIHAQNRPRRGVAKNIALLRTLREASEEARADVVVAFMPMTNMRTVLALLTSGRRTVVTEHTDPGLSALPRFWRLARRLIYPFASCLVSVSSGVDQSFGWLPARKRRVIYNPVIFPEGVDTVADLPESAASRKRLVAMGRLTHPKGFDLLVTAFAQIADRHRDWSLTIFGEGSERERLETQVRQAGLRERVHLPGFVSNPTKRLTEADLFVVSSRWEGFCLVLAEAMAAGLPAVSFNCPSGPSELITHGHDGLLVEAGDVDGLARALDNLMQDGELRGAFGTRARHSVERFRVEAIVDQWEALLDELVLATPRVSHT